MSLSLASRASGLLLGQTAAAGRGIGPSGAAARLAFNRVLGEELLVADPDLGRLTQRWAAMAGDDAPLDAGARAGFAHLREHGSPRVAGGTERPALPLHLLPVALLTFENPRNVTALTWHLAALTHPDPASTWGAVAVNVAAARLLQGHRDFVPDVIEALRNNEAPPLLLETVRRLPLLRRENIDAVAGTESPAVGATCAALWAAHTEPRTAAAVEWLEQLPPSAAAAGAGLLGARDGIEALRIALGMRAVDLNAVRRLAEQLARIAPPERRA